MIDIMLDLETMSTDKNAAIISIGACRFDFKKRGEIIVDYSGTVMGKDGIIKTGKVMTEHDCLLKKHDGILDTFYMTINLDTCIKRGFHVDPDTVNWWAKQSPEARKSLEGTTPLGTALKEFLRWHQKGGQHKSTRMWGNGSDFDNAILDNAFRKFGKINAWEYWLNRCYRTIDKSYGKVHQKKSGTAHNALDDSINQALHLMKIVEETGQHCILS